VIVLPRGEVHGRKTGLAGVPDEQLAAIASAILGSKCEAETRPMFYNVMQFSTLRDAPEHIDDEIVLTHRGFAVHAVMSRADRASSAEWLEEKFIRPMVEQMMRAL